jgi:hypothetical protein
VEAPGAQIGGLSAQAQHAAVADGEAQVLVKVQLQQHTVAARPDPERLRATSALAPREKTPVCGAFVGSRRADSNR